LKKSFLTRRTGNIEKNKKQFAEDFDIIVELKGLAA